MMTEPESFVLSSADITCQLPADTFSPDMPLDVDIGCGKGRFLMGRATNNPDRQILGIDRLKGRIRKVDGKIRRAHLNNAKLLRLEAFYSVAYLLPDNRVSAFFVLFPDPWPKRRHSHRRLFRPEFLATLARKLQASGEIHVATDHFDYFAQIRALFEADSRFGAIWPYQRDESERTNFEHLFRSKGFPVAEASYRLLKPIDAPPACPAIPLTEPRPERQPSR